MRIHLEGLGFVGSVLAHTLAAAGVKFTWNDINSPTTAWKSSTATVLPSAGDAASYDRWTETPDWIAPYVERGAYWYHSKTAPGAAEIAHDVDMQVARRHRLSSIHVNAERFVLDTRAHFELMRISNRFGDPLIIRTHGFTDATHYLWGWSGYARIDTILPCGLRRPCLYGRATRYELAYAYPWPGTNQWRIGSELVNMRQCRSRAHILDDCADRWRGRIHRMFGETVTVSDIGGLQEGWRPMGPEEYARVAGGEHDAPLLRREGTRLWRIVPMGRFGVRWALSAAHEVMQELERH